MQNLETVLKCPGAPNLLGVLDFSYAPNLLFYSYIPIIILSLFLSIFILIKVGKKATSITLFLVSLFFAIWSLNIMFQWLAVPSTINLFSWQLTALLELPIYILTVIFVFSFINKEKVFNIFNFILAVPYVAVLILTPTNYNINIFNITSCEGVLNFLLPAVYKLEIIYVVLPIIIYLYAKAKKTTTSIKDIIVVIATFLFLAIFWASVYFGELTKTYQINLIGPIGMVVFMGFLAYLIVKYKAFNIKLLGAQALIVAQLVMIGAMFFFATSTTNIILLAVTLVGTSIMGWYLIRSVKEEVRQREALEVANAEITERKEQLQQMSDSLALANDRLRQLDQAKTDFVSMASHQLRRSPTSIKGFTSLLLEGSYGKISPEVKDVLEKMYKSNEVQIAFVEDLLNVSRLESGSVKFEFAPAGVEELCQDAVDALALKAKDAGLYLDFKKPKNPLPEVMMDKAKIREVISNLVDNAIKYTKKGGVTLLVEACQKKEGNCLPAEHIRITVSDTGIGIPTTEIPYLFSKFSRGKDTTRLNANGTGLGLYVVKMMTGGNGGKVWVESDGDGKGSRFIVELPVEQSQDTLMKYA